MFKCKRCGKESTNEYITENCLCRLGKNKIIEKKRFPISMIKMTILDMLLLTLLIWLPILFTILVLIGLTMI